MSYSKQNFAKGDVLLASQLNAMDDQIALNEETIGQNSASIVALNETVSVLDEKKADKTSLEKTDRIQRAIIDFLNGKAFRFETDSTEAYAKNVLDGARLGALKMLGGKTQKWNKLIDIAEDITTVYGAITRGTDGSVIYAVSTPNRNARLEKRISLNSNHRYYYYRDVTSVKDVRVSNDINSNANKVTVLAGERTKIRLIAEPSIADSPVRFYFDTYENNFEIGDTIKLHNWFIVDLTAIYGAGNEPTNVSDSRIAWIEQYAEGHPEYDEGSLINAVVTSVESEGTIVSDGQWVFGYWNSSNGTYSNRDTTQLCSKSKFSIEPNSDLIIVNGNERSGFRWFDESNNYISFSEGNRAIAPSNAYYVAINLGATYGTELKNGTVVRTTFHESKPIPQSIIDLPCYGMGIGDAHNDVEFEPVTFYNIKAVDLGLYNWTYNAQYDYMQTVESVANEPNGYVENALYTLNRNSGSTWSNGRLRLFGTGYTDAEEFKTVCQGKIFRYEASDGTGEVYKAKLYHQRVDSIELDGRRYNYSASDMVLSTPFTGAKDNGQTMHVKYENANSYAQITSGDNKVRIRTTDIFVRDLELGESGVPSGTLIYELATPRIFDVTDMLAEFDNMFDTETGGTVTFENVAKLPVPNAIEYAIKIDEVV